METNIQTSGFDNESANTIVFSFAGQGSAQVVGFEWVNFFAERPIKVVNVRDLSKAYYMGKLYYADKDKFSEGVDQHTELFKEIIDESKCKNVIMTGSSLGGYAAALYGVLLNATHTLPYSAQTFIREHPAYGKNDRPHLAEWARRAASHEDQERYFDLTDLNYENFTGEMHFHWCTSWRDERYYNHMKEFCENFPKNKNKGCPEAGDMIDVKIHDITYRHAKLCQKLKQAGILDDHFKNIIS